MHHSMLPPGVVPEFKLGTFAITGEAFRKLPFKDVCDALARHSQCDWGDVSAEDETANSKAIDDGSRILSVYHDRKGVKFWIITEADRSTTTVLLPDDY
jgi:hypothetical protein